MATSAGGKGKGKSKGPIDCFICGGDHFARDCRELCSGKDKGGPSKGGFLNIRLFS